MFEKSQRTIWTKQDKTSYYYYVYIQPLGSSTMIGNISASMSNENAKYLNIRPRNCLMLANTVEIYSH